MEGILLVAKYLSLLLLVLPLYASAEMLKDPTVPLNYSDWSVSVSEDAFSQNGMKLSAIYVGNKPYAVISNKVVHVGDDFNGYKIAKIARGYVELENNSEKLKLTIYKNNIIVK